MNFCTASVWNTRLCFVYGKLGLAILASGGGSTNVVPHNTIQAAATNVPLLMAPTQVEQEEDSQKIDEGTREVPN